MPALERVDATHIYCFLVQTIPSTLCFKKGHPFCFCYNFVSRDQILVFLAVW